MILHLTQNMSKLIVKFSENISNNTKHNSVFQADADGGPSWFDLYL